VALVARRIVPAVALCAAIAATGCTEPLRAFGATEVEAKSHAEAMFASIGTRFDSVTRDAHDNRSRLRFAGNFLAPSGIFADTSVWTSSRENERTFVSHGKLNGRVYEFSARGNTPLPTVAGESRHHMTLISRGHDQYTWDTGVEMAMGPMRAASAEEIVTALVASAAAKPDWTTTSPRSTAAIGRGFAIQRLHATPAADGSQTVELELRLHPELLKPKFPRFGQFLEKFIGTSGFDLQLTDKRGAQWVLFAAKKNIITLKLREIGGHFAPLQGPIRPIPDSLRLVGSATAHGAFATVGINDIDGEFIITRTPNERAWTIRLDHEPRWDFPLSMNRLVSGPLRTPFQGEGVTYQIGFRDGANGQLIQHRAVKGTFQETRLIRWMGSLAGSVFSDWGGPVEPEANRFIADVFLGLRDDATAYFVAHPAAPVPPVKKGDGAN
jgi:hypothetical protein